MKKQKGISLLCETALLSSEPADSLRFSSGIDPACAVPAEEDAVIDELVRF